MEKKIKIKTVLIICCLNEAKTISEIIRRAKLVVDSVLVIDGHSTDNSVDLARKAGAKVYLDNGRGKGEAIRMGIRLVKKNDIIVFMDCDGSHEINDIKNIVKPIRDNKADLVIASRGKGGSDELSGSVEKFCRLIGSSIITLVINLRYKSKITDSQNGFRAIRASVSKKINLQENGFAIEQEMLMKVLKNGYRVAEVPSHEYERKYGKSRINLFWETGKYFLSLVKGII